MSRFFVQLIKRVSEKEDVFTECVTGALQENPDLARRFVRRLCGDHLEGIEVATAAIAGGRAMFVPSTSCLGGHPKPASHRHLKTGQ